MAEKSLSPTSGPSRWLDPLNRFRAEMERFFDNLNGGGLFPREVFETGTLRESMVVPQMDLRETEKSYVVTAELPGMEEKDIDVSLADGVLTMKGEKKSETISERDSMHVTERRYGSFQRSVRLPEGIDEDKVTASFDKGVLRIEVPKSPAAIKPPKKIQIGTQH